LHVFVQLYNKVTAMWSATTARDISSRARQTCPFSYVRSGNLARDGGDATTSKGTHACGCSSNGGLLLLTQWAVH